MGNIEVIAVFVVDVGQYTASKRKRQTQHVNEDEGSIA
jgi:hypothetical protein